MMDLIKRKTRIAGLLFLVGMVAGIFSVAPVIDAVQYLTEAAANANQVILATIFQLSMAFAYLGIVILLFPTIKRFGESLAIGFLTLRILAATLVFIGALLLPALLVLSQEFVKDPFQSPLPFQTLGNVLKNTRDYINHVFMILALCTGNLMFYILLLKSKLIPRWLSVWGLMSNFLSVIASILVLFQVVEIITPEYLVLNLPTALQELILGIWLIVKGFDIRSLDSSENINIKYSRSLPSQQG